MHSYIQRHQLQRCHKLIAIAVCPNLLYVRYLKSDTWGRNVHRLVYKLYSGDTKSNFTFITVKIIYFYTCAFIRTTVECLFLDIFWYEKSKTIWTIRANIERHITSEEAEKRLHKSIYRYLMIAPRPTAATTALPIAT